MISSPVRVKAMRKTEKAYIAQGVGCPDFGQALPKITPDIPDQTITQKLAHGFSWRLSLTSGRDLKYGRSAVEYLPHGAPHTKFALWM